MLHEEDALWVQIFRHKYFPDYNPLHYASLEGSWVWKGVCEVLETIRNHYCWEVGDGRKISIWKDRWVPFIMQLLSSRFSSADMETVNQLMIPDSNQWDMIILNAFF